MPATDVANGTQACTVDQRHVLTSGTAPTGGRNYFLALDTSALTVGQWLEVEVLRSILTGGTLRAWGGGPVTIPHGSGWADSPVFRIPAGRTYEVAITQRGASGGRSIPWSWETVE